MTNRSLLRGVDPRTLPVTILLVGMVALGPLSTDMYLPSLPDMTRVFGASVSTVQLTLSVFAIGLAAGMLMYGPLSDRFGRRPVVIVGLILYFVTSAACMVAPSIDALIVGRFFQAIGACSGGVLGRAIVRDVYGRHGAARMLSYMSSAMALAPALAPILGGWLHETFGWHAPFGVMAGVGGLLALLSLVLLRETNPYRDPSALAPVQIGRNFATLIRDRHFLGHALVVASAFGGLFSYISGSSFVVIEILGVEARHFGYTFFFVAGSYLVGALWGGRVTQRVGTTRMVTWGLMIAAAFAGIGVALAWSGVETLWSVLPPVCGHFFACAFIMPNGQAGAIGPYPRMAGSASSLVGFLQMAIGAVAGYAVGLFFDGTTRPLMTVLALSTLLGAVAWVLLVRPHRPDPEPLSAVPPAAPTPAPGDA